MKSITINIEDNLYIHLKEYSEETEEGIEQVLLRSIEIGFVSMKSGVEKALRDIEDWKRARNFGRYGKRKVLSHTLRG